MPRTSILLCLSLIFGNIHAVSNEAQDPKTQKILKKFEEELKKDPNNLMLTEALGDAYYSIRNYTLATELYQQALKIDPNNQKIKVQLALSLLFNDEWESSDGLFNETYKENPKNPDILFGLGRIEQIHLNFKKAEEFYQEALKIDPNHLASLSYLGELRLQQKRYEDALEIFKKIQKLHPKEVWVKQSLLKAELGSDIDDIKLLADRGKQEEAISKYKELVKAHPNFLDPYFLLGQLYTKMGNYDDALKLYQSGLKVNPEASSLLVGRAFTLLAKGDFVQSKTFFESVVEANPHESDAHVGLGRLAEIEGQSEEAEKQFKRALQIDPGNIGALNLLAELKSAQKKYEEAESLYKRLQLVDPKSEWIFNALEEAKYGALLDEIQSNEEHHHYLEAEKLYNQILLNDPRNPAFYLGLGQLYSNMKRYRQAIQVYLKGLRIQPKSTVLLLGLSYAYLLNGNLELARRNFESILESNPDSPEALTGMGRLAELSGNTVEAQALYQKALSFDKDNLTTLSFMGNLLLKTQKYQEAGSVFTRILENYPKAIWARDGLEAARSGPIIEAIKTAEQANDLELAESFYLQLINESPEHVGYYLQLGQLYKRMDLPQNALEIYLEGLRIQPHSAELLIALGFIYLDQKNFEQSKILFQDALDINPNNPDALAGLGKIEQLSDRKDQARYFYEKSLNYDPNNISALAFQASLFLDEKQFSKSEEIYNRLRRLLPTANWVKMGLSEAKSGPLREEISRLEKEPTSSLNEQNRKRLALEKLYHQLITQSPYYVEAYLGIGQLYAKMGRFQEAIKIYKKGLNFDPKETSLHDAMGFSYIYLNQFDEASNEFQTALQINPKDAEAMAGLGRLAELTGNQAQAENYYQEALDLNPDNITALSFLGNLEIRKNRYAEAKEIFDRLEKLLPHEKWVKNAIQTVQVAPILSKIHELQENQNYKQAASLYLDVLAEAPDNQDYYLGYGNLHVRMREYKEAIKIFKEGLEKHPESPQLREALGISYLLDKDLDFAKIELDIANAQIPNNPEVLAGLGRIDALQGKPEKAEALYLLALETGPYNVSALSFYGDLLLKQKRYKEAATIFTRLRELDPKAPWIRRALKEAENGPLVNEARVLEGFGELKAAKKRYLALIGTAPDNADYYNYLGAVYLKMDKIDEAIEVFQIGLALDPDADYLWKILGFAYLSKEYLDAAQCIFLALIDKNPNDAEIWAGLGKIEEMRGNTTSAEGYYEKALGIDPNNVTALSYLAAIRIRQNRFFSALDIHQTLLCVQPQANWVKKGISDLSILTHPSTYVEGRYHEEDQYDKDAHKWSARYRVYGASAWVNFPIDNTYTLFPVGSALDYYNLEDRLDNRTVYWFTVPRFHVGIKRVLNSYWIADVKFGTSVYGSAGHHSTFREESGWIPEPTLVLNYHDYRRRAAFGLTTDADLIARDFTTLQSKLVGRYYVFGRYEQEIIKKGVIGFEGDYYMYADYANNSSRRAIGWINWSPPQLYEYLSFRYHCQYQGFAKVIPDYYTYKYQIMNHVQMDLYHTWDDIFSFRFAYAHGWLNTRTRFSQIIVVAPTTPVVNPTQSSSSVSPFFNDHRQYNMFFLNSNYKQDQLELNIRADYYRDSKKYTMWSVIGTIGWHFGCGIKS